MFESGGSEFIKQSAMIGLGGQELWIVLGIVVLLFGGAKIPQMMKGFGEGMKEFKKASRDEDEERLDKRDPDKRDEDRR